MDISDISKVAGRKRMNNDVEKLREKVSRETAKIIKLKVAQDTAYWDLKEKLQQVEGNHERLHQNMVLVQMEHEALSARLQDELRLRPETLNRLGGARGVCAALEECGERLRAGVARARADQAALAAAYRASGRAVAPLAAAARAERARGRAADDAASRADAARAAAEQLAAGERRRVRAEAAAAQALRLQLEAAARDLRQKESEASALRAEGERTARDLHAHVATVGALRLEAERQAAAAREECEELRRAARGAAEGEGAARQEAERARAEAAGLRAAGAEAEAARAEAEAGRAKAEAERTEAEVGRAEAEARRIEAESARAEAEAGCAEAVTRLAAVEAEAGALRLEAERMAETNGSLEKNIRQIEIEFTTYREQSDASAAKLKEDAARLGRELDSSTETIARLMEDVRALEACREAAARHQRLAREKDDELAKQMTIILEMRGEKERLQERIGGMQATIDNIQKELTGPPAREQASPPPPPEREAPPTPEAPKAPKTPKRTEHMLYDFLSDSSVDGDALDAGEVRRRFEALASGRAPPPRGPPGPRGPLAAPTRHAPISLSQMKSDLKVKERAFFKNKRLDGKVRKVK